MRKIITVSLRLTCNFACNQDTVISSLPFGEKEKSRLDSIKNPTYKLESLSALVALNDITKNLSNDVTIARTKDRKPYFEHSNLQFSLSHSEGLAVVALSDIPVGVDIELLDIERDTSRLIDRFFNEEEKALLKESSDPSLSFYTIWTKKEALLKISGKGLSGIRGQSSDSCFSHQYILSLQNKSYVMSVCATAPDDITIINTYTELTVYEL